MDTVRLLRYLGAVLALVVAVVHLFHSQYGFPRFVQFAQLGAVGDPRPLVFTPLGFAIVAGILLVYNGVAKRPVYAAGIALMVALLGGYVAWHTVLDHGGFWPYREPHGHHDIGTVEVIVNHLLADWRDLVSKTAELALLVVLAVLYVKDWD